MSAFHEEQLDDLDFEFEDHPDSFGRVPAVPAPREPVGDEATEVPA